MPLKVFFAVTLSSLFQAWWNFHLKKTETDKASFLMVGWFLFGIITTPISFLYLEKPFSVEWWPFILTTGFAQGLYLLALAKAYTLADISLIFPLARGLGVILTALVISSLGITELSWIGIVGLSAVVLGALCLGSDELRSRDARQGLLLALVLGFLVATYTVIDSLGAQQIPPVFYVLSMNITAPLFALPFLYKSRRRHIKESFLHYKMQGMSVAFAGSFGYAIVIWAYQYAPAPYIVALREISIVFATLMGFFFLKEKLNGRKLLGITFILLGILIIRLA